jgi:hypothetical protein
MTSVLESIIKTCVTTCNDSFGPLQAQKDKIYEVVITNSSGLYRYRMGDMIRVVGFHNKAPIVEFMYR